MKTKARKKQHPEYGRGYRAGIKRAENRSATVIEALRRQAENWRALYLRLRHSEQPQAADAVGQSAENPT